MTDTDFLSNKFTLAALPETVVPRLLLLPVYDRAAQSRFIYISAPAGSGKTVSTLLWSEYARRKTVWIGLDKYDSAPSVFFKQIALALFSAQPDNAGMLGVLNNPRFSASPIEHTIALINEMRPEDTPRALVLDDLHLIKNSEIFKAMPFIIRRLPHNFVVLVLSRFAPPSELMQLVDERNLISEKSLMFSQREISTYFEILGQTLTPRQSKAVFTMTEGWAMGVNAVAHSGGKGTVGSKDFDFSGYFESQIWGQWQHSLRKFCLETAVLDEFSPALAEVMTGREDAAAVLEELSRTNSFLSCLHDDIYRYHHLFQDFLRNKLNEQTNAALLYKRAAEFYKEQGDYTRALRYMMGSGEWKSIDGYILLFLFRNNRGGVAEYAEFLRSFYSEDFPDKAYKEMPALHVLSAWYYYITGYYMEFALHMDAIIKKLPAIAKAGNEFVEFSILAFSVDHRRTMAQKEKLYGLFSRFLKRYTPEGLATKIPSYTEGLPILSRSNVDYNEFALDPDWMVGLGKTFAPLLGAEWVYLQPTMDATFAYERNLLHRALELILEAGRVITPAHKIEGRVCAAFLLHTILIHMGRAQAEQAKQAEAALNKLIETEAQDFLPNLKAYKTKLRLFEGDENAAAEWLAEYFVVKTDHIELFRVYIHFVTARAFIAAGRYADARALLTLLLDFGRNLNRPMDECEAQILLAVLSGAEGQRREAQTHLEAALEISSRYNYILPVADEGIAVEPLLRRILQQTSAADYKGKIPRAYVNEVILAAHAIGRTHSRYLRKKTGGDDKPIKLSRRQKHMITLLSQGMRTHEICNLTGLSLSTVKTHLYFAYQKLGVTNAMDAVLKARERGII
jgi:LuxR family maltose regulon positive regulatory protein